MKLCGKWKTKINNVIFTVGSMRKFLFFLITIITFAFLSLGGVNGASVSVSAVVGNIVPAPVILSVTPNANPKLLAHSTLQQYNIAFQNQDQSTVFYTITPATGYVNPSSGTISTYDSSSGATISFMYLAPDSIPTTNPTTVTVTISN